MMDTIPTMQALRVHPEPTSPEAITTHALVAAVLLDQAFDWLCQRRQDGPLEADGWRFRRDWPAEKARIHEELLAGPSEIGWLDRVTLIKDGQPEAVDLWPARDAVVMQGISRVFPQ